MATTGRAEFSRLILQIERDLMDQARIRTLLTAADTTGADHRQELRTVEARINALRTVRFEYTPARELIDTPRDANEGHYSRPMPRVSFPEGRPGV